MNIRITSPSAIATIAAIIACMSSVGCGGKDPPANTPPSNGLTGGNTNGLPPGADPGTGTPTTGTPTTGTPTTGTPTTGTPTGTPPATGGATGTAQVVDPNLAAAASTALATLGATEAPGAAKEGNTIAGNFQQGQTLEQTFTMAPGKCYTIVANSMGVTQLDITAALVTPIPGMNAQFGEAKGKPGIAGSQAVLGSKNNCLKLALSPIPVQAKFTITATKGAGLAAAQLFVK